MVRQNGGQPEFLRREPAGAVQLVATAILLAALGGSTVRADALEFRVVSLVEAKAAGWPEPAATARIDPDRLSFRRKACLKATPAIPVRDAAVRGALAQALQGLARDDRRRTGRVLDAIGEWVAGAVAEEAVMPGNPAGWRSAARAITDRTGHAWERLRVIVALARAAGIPARASFNGVPVAVVWTAPPGGRNAGAWTVWDPLHPSGSFRRLPVLWLPFGAEEVPLAAVAPRDSPCRPLVDGRRYATLADASYAFAAARSTGRFPDVVTEPLSAEAGRWWEVWSIGGVCDPAPAGRFVATVPLPYVKELGYGAREHAVWVSDPARLRSVSSPLSRTDPELGGVRMALEIRLQPARPSATTGVPGA